MDAGTAKTGYIMNQAYFVYDPSDGLYHRYQYGGIHQGDEGPVAVKNVISSTARPVITPPRIIWISMYILRNAGIL